MFVNKRRLKVALLVIGFLVIGLGMYAAFQEQEVVAHTPTTVNCGLNTHQNFATSGTYREYLGVEGNTEACPYCGSQAYVTWKIYKVSEYSGYDTMHTPPNIADWNLCHGHYYVLWTWETVQLENVDCSNPNCGG